MKTTIRWLAHPASVGEGYFEHLRAAGCFGTRLLLAGSLCWLHALFPFLFVDTASRMVRGLHRQLSGRASNHRG